MGYTVYFTISRLFSGHMGGVCSPVIGGKVAVTVTCAALAGSAHRPVGITIRSSPDN